MIIQKAAEEVIVWLFVNGGITAKLRILRNSQDADERNSNIGDCAYNEGIDTKL